MLDQVRDQRWRLASLCAFFAVCAALLLSRAYSYQITDYQRYRDLASNEHQLKKPIVPRRGNLLDRNGQALAISVMYDSLYAYPPAVKDPYAAASTLSRLLGEPREAILGKLTSQSKTIVLVKRKLPADASTKIANLIGNLDLPGFFLEREPFREYPEGNIAPQLLGFVGKDFNGLAGLELSLDRDLTGEPGLLDAERDTSGGEIAVGRRVLNPPKDGRDVVLTIDRYLQKMVQRELASAIKENKAVGGIVVIMEPKTGDILAMASEPSYDLTAADVYDSATKGVYRPTPVTDMYEPGSVMKIVTMAAGLEEKQITPDTAFMDTGLFEVDGAKIQNWDKSAPGRETMTEVLINSSNVGASWVSNLLGAGRFYRYVDGFGFGKRTGIDLPGESPGRLRHPEDRGWSKADLATNSFGQGIAVTAIQMITAVAAVANDGVRVKPMIVKGFRDNGSVQDIPSVPIGRVLSSDTAKALAGMMVHVVEDNALRLSVVPGYKIAGKTGTADLPTAEGYTSGVTYASQVGFAPVDAPRFVMLVRLDGPEKVYGGQVAAPVFKRIAEQLFAYMKIPPNGAAKAR